MTRTIGIRLALVVCTLVSVSAFAGGKIRKLEPTEVASMRGEGKAVLFLDVRNGDYPNKIAGAVHVPLDEIDEWAATADKQALVVAYCACPSDGVSVRAVRRLQDLGFENAYVLKGGLGAWYDMQRESER